MKSRTNTDDNSRLKSSQSATDNIGYIDSIKDDRFNRRVRLNEEEDKYESDSNSDDTPDHTGMQDSMTHLRGIRSRDFSQSTTRSNPMGKRTPNASGVLFSGLPSNAVIQETLRKQYNGSGISRKDYSKRTKVSVLDSSLSSIYKNSVLGEYPNVENQNKDPNTKGKSISSGGSGKGHKYANTNPMFHFNKYKDISPGYTKTNLLRSNQYLEFNSPGFIKNSASNTPQSLSRDFGRELGNTRMFKL